MGWHLLSRFVLFKVIIDNIRILGIELELACNRSSCGGISLKIFACERIAPHEPRLQASSSSIPRIRILSIMPPLDQMS